MGLRFAARFATLRPFRFAALSVRVTFLLALLGVAPASAQVGTTTDVLTGLVRDSTGKPIVGAVVEATSLETQVVRTTKTDPRGRYTLLFPDGGGQA